MQSKHKKIKAFTLLELLISLALTAVLVAFAFMSLGKIQYLFKLNHEQTKFINDITRFQQMLDVYSQTCNTVEKVNENQLVFKFDSTAAKINIETKYIILQKTHFTDTFFLPTQKPVIKTLTLSNELNQSNLVNRFETEVIFKNHKFRLSFRKQYAGEHALNLLLNTTPPDEFN